ncbi:hypothetical protein SAY86_013215 [Trapa natans]|uniref:Uncharacterized protein n=1 Tax=Trapa natans TaxID=22666 RepID=A0AAN7LXZ2_TRANT|nr:hypothetical protein SAY86_013215 [Trapa natans]
MCRVCSRFTHTATATAEAAQSEDDDGETVSLCRSLSSEIEGSKREVAGREGSDSKFPQGSTSDGVTQYSPLTNGVAEMSETTCETALPGDLESTDFDTSESDEPDIVQPFLSSAELERNDFSEPAKEKLSLRLTL